MATSGGIGTELCFTRDGLLFCSEHGCLKPNTAQSHFYQIHKGSFKNNINNIRALICSSDQETYNQHAASLREVHRSQGFVDADPRFATHQMFVCSVCWQEGTLLRRLSEDGMRGHVRKYHATAVETAGGDLSGLYTLESMQKLLAQHKVPFCQGMLIVKFEMVRQEEHVDGQSQIPESAWEAAAEDQLRHMVGASEPSIASLLQRDVSNLFGCTAGLSDNDVLVLFSIDNTNPVIKFIRRTCEQYVSQVEKQMGAADRVLVEWLESTQYDAAASLGLRGTLSGSGEGGGDLSMPLRLQTREQHALVIADLLAIIYRAQSPDTDQAFKELVNKHVVVAPIYDEIATDLRNTIDVLVAEANTRTQTESSASANAVLSRAQQAVNDALFGLFDCCATFGAKDTDLPVVRYLCLRARWESVKCQRTHGGTDGSIEAMSQVYEPASIKLYSIPLAGDAVTHVAASWKYLACGCTLVTQVQRWRELTLAQGDPPARRYRVCDLPTDSWGRFDLKIEMMLSHTRRTAYGGIVDVANVASKLLARVAASAQSVVVLEPDVDELTTSKVEVGGEVFELRHVRAALSAFQSDLQAGLVGLLGEQLCQQIESFDYESVRDNPMDESIGASLHHHPALEQLRVEAIKHVGTQVVKMQALDTTSNAANSVGIRSERDALTLRKWIDEAHELIEMSCSFAHLLSAPAPASEIASAVILNTRQQDRSLFLLQGRVVTKYAHNKTLSSASQASGVNNLYRFYPKYLTSTFVGVLVALRSALVFAHTVVERFYTSSGSSGGEGGRGRDPRFTLLKAGSLFVVPDTPAGAESVRRRFAADMAKQTKGKMQCTFIAYRQFAAAVFDRNLDVGQHLPMASLSFDDHTPSQVATRSCVADGIDLPTAFGWAGADELRNSLHSSRLEHAMLGMSDTGLLARPLLLPPDLASLIIVPTRSDSSSNKRRRVGIEDVGVGAASANSASAASGVPPPTGSTATPRGDVTPAPLQ